MDLVPIELSILSKDSVQNTCIYLTYSMCIVHTMITVNLKIFAKLRICSFVKIKPLHNDEITLTDKGKLCPSPDFLTSQICLLTLFGKIKFSIKFSTSLYQSIVQIYD